MKNVNLIINARFVMTVNSQRQILENTAIVIKDGRIVTLLPSSQAANQYQAETIYDLNDHCVMPGLINNHVHCAMSMFRGLADDLPLMSWLNDYIWPAEKQYVADSFVEAGSELAIAEMIRSGTTCFNDMYFFPQATARVVERSGMRAMLGMVVMEFASNWAASVDEYLHKGQQLHDRYRNHPFIRTAYAPHAPYTVADSTLETIMVNAEEMDLPVHMHIHETAAEVSQGIETYGMRPMQRLKEIGLLSPRLIAVHMTQLNEQEMDWCAESGISIAHCPESNMKLASGFCPVADLHQRDVNISIGTDGAASNNDLDMFAEMRQTALLAKVVSGNACAVPAYDAIEMATINAAKALGIDELTGSIESGKMADLIAIDMSVLEVQPCFDIASQLVYACGRQQVTDVWVAGEQLLKQRQFTILDEDQIIAHARQWGSQIGHDHHE